MGAKTKNHLPALVAAWARKVARIAGLQKVLCFRNKGRRGSFGGGKRATSEVRVSGSTSVFGEKS